MSDRELLEEARRLADNLREMTLYSYASVIDRLIRRVTAAEFAAEVNAGTIKAMQQEARGCATCDG